MPPSRPTDRVAITGIGVVSPFGAVVTAPIICVGFGWLTARRIRVEERALRYNRTDS
ncbi:MAG: hypothetical protein QF463_11910 [Vicinamibacterales bacterium]|jgi:hypothetical protein|nr:hypothetical protein [Vicinamibacterales bacterium]MDP6609764.1 hypothetical protein [Vicinamibacterales bacterium]|tara:strand:- start:6571 stop:6741 length:171 start_codon:yes stop_codon:yes gene_type:complete